MSETERVTLRLLVALAEYVFELPNGIFVYEKKVRLLLAEAKALLEQS